LPSQSEDVNPMAMGPSTWRAQLSTLSWFTCCASKSYSSKWFNSVAWSFGSVKVIVGLSCELLLLRGTLSDVVHWRSLPSPLIVSLMPSCLALITRI